MSADGLLRVRIARDFRMVDADQGVTLGHGAVVAVPEEMAAEWLRRGWAEPVVEQPA